MAELKIKKMSEFQAEPVEWLWEPYIPLGAVTILQGDGGLGKTTISSVIAAAVTAGKDLPGNNAAARADVIMQNAEDSYSKTIRPRLELFGSDCGRIHVIDEDEQPLSFTDDRIERAITLIKPRLIIFDPVQAYFGGKDMNSTSAVRPIMKHLGRLAKQNNCAVLLIGHFHKQGNSPQYRGLGSIDIYNAARSVLTVGRIAWEDDMRAIVQNKSNLSAPGVSQAYTFNQSGGFAWLGDYEITVEELLKGKRKQKEGQDTVQPENQSAKARRLIETALSNGLVSAGDIERLAEENDISMKTFNRVKSDLGVVSVSKNGRWFWQMPIDAEYTEINSDGHGQEKTMSMSISLSGRKAG